MLKQEQMEYLKGEVKRLFSEEYSGHDYFHTIRVYNTALRIGREENADLTIVTLAALLHDVDDYKIFGGESGQCKNAHALMDAIQIPAQIQDTVCEIINTMSFHLKGIKEVTSLEGKVVQDADRLDAIGAIGIARAFAFGGNHNRVMYDPEDQPKLNMSTEEYKSNQGTTVNHFYEKLLTLKDLMNTEAAKRLADERHEFMEHFLDEFYGEWDGIK